MDKLSLKITFCSTLGIAASLLGNWGEVENVTETGSQTTLVNLASDTHDMATALIVDQRTVTLSASTFSGQWQADNLSTPFDSSDDTDIVADRKGTLVAVWTQKMGETRMVFVAEKPLGGNWLLPCMLSENTGEDCLHPRIVIEDTGDATVTWHQASGNYYVEKISDLWSAPLPLPHFGEKVTPPQLAISPLGQVLAVWVEGQQLAYLEKINGLWQDEATLLSPKEGEASHPCLAADFAGNVAVAWVQNHNLVFNAKSATGGWGQPKTLSANGQVVGQPQLLVDKQGNITLFWNVLSRGKTRVDTIHKPFGSPWPKVPEMVTPYGENVVAGIDKEGNITCAWIAGEKSISAKIKRATQAIWPKEALSVLQGEDRIAHLTALKRTDHQTLLWNNLTQQNVQSASLTLPPKPTLLNLSTMQGPASGGDILHLNGSWFLDVEQVTFEGKSVPFTVNSSTWITVKTPKGRAGKTVPVVVQTASGLSNVNFYSYVKEDEVQKETLNEGTLEEEKVAESPMPVPPVEEKIEKAPADSQEKVIEKNKEKKPKKAIKAPSKAVGSQRKVKFLSQSSLVNVVTWEHPVSGPRPKSYRIYRNANLTNLAAKLSAHAPLIFNDHHRRKETTYTYYIVAVDAEGNYSAPALVTVRP